MARAMELISLASLLNYKMVAMPDLGSDSAGQQGKAESIYSSNIDYAEPFATSERKGNKHHSIRNQRAVLSKSMSSLPTRKGAMGRNKGAAPGHSATYSDQERKNLGLPSTFTSSTSTSAASAIPTKKRHSPRRHHVVEEEQPDVYTGKAPKDIDTRNTLSVATQEGEGTTSAHLEVCHSRPYLMTTDYINHRVRVRG